jgi:hypothetical protein
MGRQKKPPTHTTQWEDQRSAMLAACNGHPLSPGNSPILFAGEPIQCPICKKFIVLRWNVHIAEMRDAEVEKLRERRGIDVG